MVTLSFACRGEEVVLCTSCINSVDPHIKFSKDVGIFILFLCVREEAESKRSPTNIAYAMSRGV